MKKVSYIMVSIVLCFSIVVGLGLPSFAKEEKTAFIVVSGMNTFPLYDENGTELYPLSTETILKMVSEISVPTLRYLVDKNPDALGDKIFPALKSAFSVLACDKNGDSILNLDTKTFSGSMKGQEEYYSQKTSDELAVIRAGVEKYGAENTYFFNYDWRCDPLNHADKLNKLIKSIKSETGCDRIALAAFSMGGTVTCSYLYKYGSTDIDTVVLCSTAFQGTSSVGSLFTADVGLSMGGLINRLGQLTRDNTLEALIKYLNSILETVGINSGLNNFANGLQYDLCDRMYSEFITPIFGYMPGLWALVTDKDYEDSKSFILNKEENSELIKCIDEYHYNVQNKAEDLLKSAKKDTNVYIIAQYNMQGLPVSEESSSSNNDYLIDTEYASGGATCSLLGTTLGNNYSQAISDGHNHLSADGQIDASTCMLPESTWFIRDMGHIDYPYGDATDFIMWLSETQKSEVCDDTRYPQFMTYSYETNKLTPVTKDNPKSTAVNIAFEILTEFTIITLKAAKSLVSQIIK